MSDVQAYALQSGVQRVIGYLLRDDLLAESGSKAVSITLPTNKGVIASRLNLTPQHFSRILHELTEAGLIRVDGRIVHVPDVDKLRAYE